jgi:D-psicose/D-tagatose/L-ribulose 3-epimerase
MNFSVSNIAWALEDSNQVLNLLQQKGISLIEVAPTIYFPNTDVVEAIDVKKVIDFWSTGGIQISSLQSLFFNKPHLQLFSDDATQKEMRKHLKQIGKIGEWFGAKPLVFGSPKNRLKGALTTSQALSRASNFFEELKLDWDFPNVFVAIEANPPEYGSDFLTNSVESKLFVERLNSPIVKWHLDYGCSELEGPSALECLRLFNDSPSHVHLSEQNLGPLKLSSEKNYVAFLKELKDLNYSGVVTLEVQNLGLDSLSQSLDIYSEVISQV